MARAKTVAEGWVPIRHGIPSSYNRGCHCDECREANTLRARRTKNNQIHRARNLEARVKTDDGSWYAPTAPFHGTHDIYTRYGCRCKECCAGNAQYNATYNQSRREKANLNGD